MPLTVNGTIRVSDAAHADRIRAELPEHIRLSRDEPGNLHFNITETEPGVWTVDEAFVDKAAFQAHGARMAAASWASVNDGIVRDLTIEEDA